MSLQRTEPIVDIGMSLAVISHLLNETTAVDVANQAEYEWHQDPTWDPFYELYET